MNKTVCSIFCALLLACPCPLSAQGVIVAKKKAAGGGSAPTLVSGQAESCDTNGSTSTTLTCQFPGNITTGNLIHYTAAWYDFDQTVEVSVTDDCSNSYTEKIKAKDTASNEIAIEHGYDASVSGGSSCVVTLTATSATYMALHIYEVTGQHGTPSDVSGSNIVTASSASMTATASGATSTGNQLIFFSGVFGTALTPTAGTGWTLREISPRGPGTNVLQVQDATRSITAAETPVGVIDVAPNTIGYVGLISSYKGL